MDSSLKAKCAFVYAGIGTQWKGMGADLLQEQSIFKETLELCDSIFAQFAKWSIVEEISRCAESSRIDNLLIAHPCNVAIQIALTSLLKSWKIEPQGVIGHSSGEVAAAYMAGVLSLKEVMQLTYNHCQLMSNIIGKGVLLHIGLPEADVRQILKSDDNLSNSVWIAAINSPSATVITGARELITNLSKKLEAKKIFCRILKIDIPYHSPIVEPFSSDFHRGIEDVKPKPAVIPIYSTLRGSLPKDDDFGANYWVKHIREPVRFSDAINSMLSDGYTTFIEISPHGVLSGAIEESAKSKHASVVAISTLKRFTDSKESLTDNLSLLAESGDLDLDIKALPHEFEQIINKKVASIKSIKQTNHLQSIQTLEATENLIRDAIITVTHGTHIPPLDNMVGFLDMGLTSQHAVRLANYLSDALKKNLSATMMFDHPNIVSLAKFLSGQTQNGVSDNREEHIKIKNRKDRDKIENRDIAIIGMACRFPYQSDTPAKFYELLLNKECVVKPVPKSRWDSKLWLDPNPDALGKAYSQVGGFIDDSNIFNLDASFFKISPKEALSLDPQQRLLLETIWEAFEYAGALPSDYSGKRVGVYIGLSTMDYMGAHLWSSNPERIDGYSATGGMYSAAAGRISYLLNLNGPNFPVDTACSSALVALDCACSALRSGVVSSAVVAGVNVMVHPHMFVYFSKLGALSPSGRCRSFDADADGYVRGEGAGAILLKTLDQAIADNDRVLSIIKGIASNHDGASSSFTAPNGSAQQDVIRLALEDARISNLDVDYVEAHGTGTKLGDPIEIQALGAVYGEGRPKDRPLWVSSVKANIGHLEAAAGMASLIKTIMVLNSGTIPSQVGFENPNPLISWDNLPIKVPKEPTNFGDKNRPRIAGISGFGFSGTNVHLILSQPHFETNDNLASDNNNVKAANAEYLLKISAKTPSALKAYCRNYIEFLKKMDDKPQSLVDLCYTAYVGRTPFDYQCNFKGAKRADIIASLESFLSDSSATIERATSAKRAIFIDEITNRGKKISIPTYPFQKKRFWLSPINESSSNEKTDKDNIVAYYEFSKEYPSFISEHIIYGEPIVPAAAYISQLFSYVKSQHQSSNSFIGAGVDISFTAPMVVNQDRSVQFVSLNTKFKIISRTKSDPWITHCEGFIESTKTINHETVDSIREFNKPFSNWVEDFCKNSTQTINGSDFYANFKKLGYNLGEGFCRIEEAYFSPKNGNLEDKIQAICRINLRPNTTTQGYDLYPGFIDSMLQSLVFGAPQILKSLEEKSKILIPFALERFEVYSISLPESVISIVNTTHQGADYLQGDIKLFSLNGDLLLRFVGLTVRLTDRDTLLKGLKKTGSTSKDEDNESKSTQIYTLKWRESEESQSNNNLKDKQSQINKNDEKIKSQRCLIFGDKQGVATQIAKELENKGVRYKVILQEDIYKYDISQNSDKSDSLKKSIESLIQRFADSSDSSNLAILYLWACDLIFNDNLTAEQFSQQNIDAIYPALTIIQTLAKLRLSGKFYAITTGAFSVLDSSADLNPTSFQQTIWGFQKSVAIEYPEYFGGLIDLDTTLKESEINRFITDFLVEEHLDQCAYRTTSSSSENNVVKLFKPYIFRDDFENLNLNIKQEIATVKQHLDPNGAYLITGAFGGLGLPIAHKMVQLGARQIWLLGRKSPNSKFFDDVKELENNYKNLEISFIYADVGQFADLASALKKLHGGLSMLKGVIHLAGVRQDALLPLQSVDGLKKVMLPKAVGAWNLHNLVKGLELDFFILFSSAASLLGSQGQTNYSAANALLDGLADYRRSIGLPALSVQWGPWAESGMAATESVVHKNLTDLGFAYISPEHGLKMVETLIKSASSLPNSLHSSIGIFECNWDQYLQRTGQYHLSIFQDLIGKLALTSGTSKQTSSMWQKLSNLLPEERERELLSQLATLAQEVSGVDMPITPDLPLMEQGFDSLMAVEFRNQLQKLCGFSLPVTLLFSYPGVLEIAAFLQKKYFSNKKTIEVQKNEKSVKPDEVQPPNIDSKIELEVELDEQQSADFTYLDELTPEELNELILKELK
ncbi:MAG: SDR family NAD(P)-dependent oxidoreductase [Desulfamplus sp.]|nr:SDR family NAD(P)-dependent oxidoreductase [Desulfamplus sp.]